MECKKCNDSGFILYEKFIDGLPYIFAEKCPDCNGGEAALKKAKEQAKMPSVLYDVTMDDFDWKLYKKDDLTLIDTSRKQQTVENYISQFPEFSPEGMGLYIYSSLRGTGKTYLASAITNTLMKKYNIKARFVSAADLISIDKEETLDPYSDRYSRKGIEQLCNCEFLILDDIGAGNVGSGWTEEILFRIIDKRISNKRVTIYTSNNTLDDLPVDDRVADRIEATTILVSLPEVKIRSKKANDKKRALLERVGIKL